MILFIQLIAAACWHCSQHVWGPLREDLSSLLLRVYCLAPDVSLAFAQVCCPMSDPCVDCSRFLVAVDKHDFPRNEPGYLVPFASTVAHSPCSLSHCFSTSSLLFYSSALSKQKEPLRVRSRIQDEGQDRDPSSTSATITVTPSIPSTPKDHTLVSLPRYHYGFSTSITKISKSEIHPIGAQS